MLHTPAHKQPICRVPRRVMPVHKPHVYPNPYANGVAAQKLVAAQQFGDATILGYGSDAARAVQDLESAKFFFGVDA